MTQPLSIDQLMEQLTTFARSGEALLEALVNSPGDEGHGAKRRAEESLDAVKERFRQLQNSFLGEARDALDAGETYIRDHPWKAVAIAAGIGYLAGALMSRRRPVS